MSNDYRDPAFKKWLDKLQQESWQLELIISGFAIYGLFVAYGTIVEEIAIAENTDRNLRVGILMFTRMACIILMINLLIHVVLRGLWIGALGLRYVSGDIDYEHLKYSDRFKKFLQKKIGSFDRYIANLENYCSILFAISFLLIFYVIALFMFVFSILGIVNFVVINDYLPEGPRQFIGGTFILFIALGAGLTFFDFITQGLLKRNKWVAKVYFPFYWVFSFVTLSFIYRPIVYNFLDNRFGKRISLLLIPIYLLLFFVATLQHRESNFIPETLRSSSIVADIRNYEDEMEIHDEFVRIASIPSKIIQGPSIKVFVAYTEGVENAICKFDTTLGPKEDLRGLETKIQFTNNDFSLEAVKERDSFFNAYVKTFNEMYSVHVDSLKYDPEFIVSTNAKGQRGFETYVATKDIPEGKHMLKVVSSLKRKDSVVKFSRIDIPFWHYKE